MANGKLTTDQVPEGPRLPITSNCCQIRRPETGLKPRQRIKVLIETPSVSSMAAPGIADSIRETKTGMTDQVGQIFVVEDPQLDVTITKNITRALKEVEGQEQPTIDWIRAFKEFAKKNGDHYDFVAMVPTGMPEASQLQPHHVTVFNDVAGIGLDQCRRRGLFHSRRLQGIAALDSVLAGEQGQRLHEIGHRWLAYVGFKKRRLDRSVDYSLLAFDNAHWGKMFDKARSCMGGDGKQWNDWIENSDSSFTSRPFNPNSSHWGYCPLDLYLMGMLAPSEVPSFSYIDNQRRLSLTDQDRYSGTRVNLTVDNIILAHGRRRPHAVDSQRSFRLAFVVLTKDLDKGKQLAETLEKYRIAVTEQFRQATRSRGLLDTHLYKSSYDGIYMRHHELDTGKEPSKPTDGVFWDSPDIWVRNKNDGGKTHQDVIRGQDNWIYVRVRNKGATPSGEITVNLFQAELATEFLYPQDWKWDKDYLIGSKIRKSVRAGGSCLVKFKWRRDKILPTIVPHVYGQQIGGPPSLLAEILPIHPTQTKLRYVWEDRRIAQKNVTFFDYPPPLGIPFELPFLIGARSFPKRLLQIRVQQKEGTPLGKVSIDLGRKEEVGWQKARGGHVIEQDGDLVFVIKDGCKGGDITLPLLEAEPKTLKFKLELGSNLPTSDAKFEITQLNERNEVVGGLDLIVRNGRSNHL